MENALSLSLCIGNGGIDVDVRELITAIMSTIKVHCVVEHVVIDIPTV